ncbi:MAG: SMC-Scp complex subunit ScpB [Pseudomonadota bacterium]
MDKQHTKNVVEAALMCAGAPLDVNEILRLFDEGDRPGRKALIELMDELAEDYAERSIELRQVASGYRIQVRTEFADMLGRLDGKRAPKYSRALLETLALVAYRQPVTRGEIESVRGVSVSSNMIHTLLERGWVRIVGHRDVPGRPAMLGTTKGFLDYFGLTTLDDLPALSELKDFDSINVELEFGAAPSGEPGDEGAEASAADADEAADVHVQDEHDAAVASIMDDEADGADAETEAASDEAADDGGDASDDTADDVTAEDETAEDSTTEDAAEDDTAKGETAEDDTAEDESSETVLETDDVDAADENAGRKPDPAAAG